jgi:hypothetical protein
MPPRQICSTTSSASTTFGDSSTLGYMSPFEFEEKAMLAGVQNRRQAVGILGWGFLMNEAAH